MLRQIPTNPALETIDSDLGPHETMSTLTEGKSEKKVRAGFVYFVLKDTHSSVDRWEILAQAKLQAYILHPMARTWTI